MDIASIIFWAVIAGLVLYTISIYNHLVRLKHNVSKAWSNIDVLLKQRHDEIPKLVETCKQYMKFEQETLEKVMQARSRVAQARQSQDVPGLGLAEGCAAHGFGAVIRAGGRLSRVARKRRTFSTCKAVSVLSKTPSPIGASSIMSRPISITSGSKLSPKSSLRDCSRFGERDLLEFEAGEIADVNVKQLFESGAAKPA